MHRPPERSRAGQVAAYVGLLTLLTISVVPIYYYVEPVHRVVVVSVSSGIVLALVFQKLVTIVREQLNRQPISRFEAAAQLRADHVSLAPGFEKLRGEVENSLRDRSYFEQILRARLSALYERRLRNRFGAGAADPAKRLPEGVNRELFDMLTRKPQRRTLLRRGIPLRELQALVKKLEDF
jgi:hypothetical protein